MPPKLAPYPTLVGTAMTGTSTSPPTTLGKRAFHAGDDDDDMCGRQARVLGEQPMQARDADVVEPIDGVPHDFRRDRRFLGDGQVGRAGGRDDDGSPAGWHRRRAQCNGSRQFME